MRYESASADYAEFGEFFVGRDCDPAEWLATLERWGRPGARLPRVSRRGPARAAARIRGTV